MKVGKAPAPDEGAELNHKIKGKKDSKVEIFGAIVMNLNGEISNFMSKHLGE